MRIILDMQGAQTESRFRGIGRYTLSFARGVVRNRGEHEIFLAVNGRFPDTVETIRDSFHGLLPQENIRVWNAPAARGNPEKDRVWDAAGLLQEAFLIGLAPDVIHLSSLFEGFHDSAATDVGCFDQSVPVTVTLYDLIPLANPDRYLSDPRFALVYMEKTEHLKRAALCLAISEFSRREAWDLLKIPDERIVTVSSAVEPWFRPLAVDEGEALALRRKFGLTGQFLFSAGGAEDRKNLPRLIQAFAALPEEIRRRHQLLLAGKMPPEHVAKFRRVGYSAGLGDEELLFPGYVPDEDLVRLYNLCTLYIFPSWQEGFGLPALEAMACGAPVIGSGTSSLPEVIGLEEALFDPFDISSIKDKILRVLQDESFRTALRDHGLRQAQRFSWDETARRAIEAWESLESKGKGADHYLENSLRHRRLIQSLAGGLANAPSSLLAEVAAAVAQNRNSALERQLFLDVSELCRHDAATGIQLVVKNCLEILIAFPPRDFRIEPVYAREEKGYYYARAFTVSFLGQEHEVETPPDDPVQWQRGDIFFGLDMQHHLQLAHRDFFRQLRSEGVTVKFLVHDLLPIQMPHLFRDSDLSNLYEEWLKMIASCDGAVCLSQATADAYKSWLSENGVVRSANFSVSWVHNGGDIDGEESLKKLKTLLVEENYPRRQLLVDLSEFVCRDAGSGIQRVVRNIVREWMLHPPEGWRVEPVYASVDREYCYARKFFADFPGGEAWGEQDDPIEYSPGDIFLALDLQNHIVVAKRVFFQEMRKTGVKVFFVVYDLLPLNIPCCFPPAVSEVFRKWLSVVAESDGAFCISATVAGELSEWLKKHGPGSSRPFRIDWFHLGSDEYFPAETGLLSPEEEEIIALVRSRPSFLMVGTVEPRKGHYQALEAFNQLWGSGKEISLVIVGRKGWMVESIAEILRSHPEKGKRLFWLEGIRDEFLEKVYEASACLLALSEGEGFGLPLVEAARHKLPIIARDIPVFREIAGDHAMYFSARDRSSLAECIRKWMELQKTGRHPRSEDMRCKGWRESAAQLLDKILPRVSSEELGPR